LGENLASLGANVAIFLTKFGDFFSPKRLVTLPVFKAQFRNTVAGGKKDDPCLALVCRLIFLELISSLVSFFFQFCHYYFY
jgi:hypothetical protein